MTASSDDGQHRPRILVINLHSSRNLGDAAITEETIRQLRRNFPGCHITLSMNDPASRSEEDDLSVVSSFKFWFCPIDEQRRERWQPLAAIWYFFTSFLALLSFRLLGRPLYLDRNRDHWRLMAAFFSADLVISCGGILLQTRRWLAGMYLWIIYSMAYALIAGKPLYMMPQSVGPLVKGWHRWVGRAILRRMRLLILRETVSLSYIQDDLGISDRPRCVVPDVAFCYPGGDQTQAADRLGRHGVDVTDAAPRVGMTFINWGAQHRNFQGQAPYESAMQQLIEHIVSQIGAQVVLFNQVVGPSLMEDDGVVARRLRDRLAHLGSRVMVVDEYVSPRQIKAMFSHMDLLVGTRMHSVILATSGCVPTMAISYQPKTWGTMEELGLKQYVCDIEPIDAGQLIAIFDSAWQNRGDIHDQLENVMPEIVERAQQAGVLIAQDWYALAEARG